jgi:hypothetical protein
VQSGISLNSTVVAVEDQVSSQVGDEAVILHMRDGIYYGLDPVGAGIWELLQEPRTVHEIRDRLLSEYEVEGARCEADLLSLLQELMERRLVRVASADA